MGVGIPDPSVGHIRFTTSVAGRLGWLLITSLLVAIFMAIPGQASAEPVAEQPGFYIEEVFGGYEPESSITAVRFAPESDGRAFVAERRGRILVFDDIDDATPDAIDLTAEVHGWWDRGLLGLAVHPDFPAEPWIYTFYTLDTGDDWQDGPWGGPGLNDDCPDPPGGTTDGCVVEGRLSRMEINGDNTAGREDVLLEGKWCFQFPSHSADDLVFGPDGMLFLSAGDGASFGNVVDYGQFGGSPGSPIPQNPCQDPPYPTAPTKQTGEGGMFRSQDIRTSDDELGYNGSILRVDPDTGHAALGNPEYNPGLAEEDQPDEARMLAHGLRNPYRMAFDADGDLYVGDVGWGIWEEINVIEGATGGNEEILNFGWPCYEGRQDELDAVRDINNHLCVDLYADSDVVTDPLFEYRHEWTVWPGAEGGAHDSSAISSISFMEGGSYPAEWDDALVFSDYNREGVWALKEVDGEYVAVQGVGNPDEPADGAYLLSNAGIVDIQSGPGGDLYLVDLDNGVFRLRYDPANVPPTARITSSALDGDSPITVDLSGATSTDPQDDPADLLYEWDLNGDGQFDEGAGQEVTESFNEATNVGLRVTDTGGKYDTAYVVVLPPYPTVNKIAPAGNWGVGDRIEMEAASRPGSNKPQTFKWSVQIHHCSPSDPNDCHVHPLNEGEGEHFVIESAPDHSYPSHLGVTVEATDPNGVKGISTLELHPRTSKVHVRSPQVPVQVSVGGLTDNTPVSWEGIQGGQISLAVPVSVQHEGRTWIFEEWSDGGPRARDITIPGQDLTLTARYNNNRPPVIASIANARLTERDTFERIVTATDPDGDGITFALTKAPSGARINSSTGVIRWTPGSSDAGKTFQFRVKATDDWSTPRSDSVTFNVTVIARETPPTSQPPTTQPPTTEPPTTVPDGSTFADTAGSVHEHDIELLAASGITFGCNPPENTLFCPEDAVTRAQMASFLVRGLDLDPADGGSFTDTAGSVHEPDINSLAAAQITLGCNPPENDRYCPDDVVTRAQMASFLVRGLHLSAGDGGKFEDVANSVHASDINALAEAGVTLGCNPPENDLYCPEDEVTRAQMASFLVRGIPLPRR